MYGVELPAQEQFAALEPMTGCGLLGALKCVAGMEGVLPMIHGPVSCSSGHRLAMLYAGIEPLLPTTCVEQTDVVMGSAQRLRRAMERAWESYHPRLLLVLLSCASAMTGEDFQAVANEYNAAGGRRVVVLDGSALAGDEVDICPKVYDALTRELGIGTGTGEMIALEGIARTDYAFAENMRALKALIENNLNAAFTPGLFAGGDPFSADSSYRAATKVRVSLLWDRHELASAAPIGVRGSFRFLQWLAKAAGVSASPQMQETRACWDRALQPAAEALRRARVPVAIEGAGWYAYALADFLKNDLGCRVLLSVDRGADVPWSEVCDEFYEDTGRFELVELMKDFGARWVFGSSNVQLDDAWHYVGFYQPVWRVVDVTALLGYEAGCNLAERIAGEEQL